MIFIIYLHICYVEIHIKIYIYSKTAKYLKFWSGGSIMGGVRLCSSYTPQNSNNHEGICLSSTFVFGLIVDNVEHLWLNTWRTGGNVHA